MTAPLIEVYAVHCFACPHTERGFDPAVLHEQMEAHYQAEHAEQIAQLAGDIRP